MIRLVDSLRRLLPKRSHPLMGSLYTLIPPKKRKGSTYWRWISFLQEAQWWSQERIEAWQLNHLKDIVQYAYKNVPGYCFLYQDAGVKPEDINSLADIRSLPFITKELLRDNLAEFTSRKIPRTRRSYVTTGGSTGIPLGFYRTDQQKEIEPAFISIRLICEQISESVPREWGKTLREED